jgi:hypothetical protein
VARHFFTSLDTHDFVETGESGYSRRNLTDTFSVSFFFPCKSFENKHTLFNSELHFSTNIFRLWTPLRQTIILMRLTAVTRSHHLRARAYQRWWLIPLSAVTAAIREKCCSRYAVFSRFPPWLNAVYIYSISLSSEFNDNFVLWVNLFSFWHLELSSLKALTMWTVGVVQKKTFSSKCTLTGWPVHYSFWNCIHQQVGSPTPLPVLQQHILIQIPVADCMS